MRVLWKNLIMRKKITQTLNKLKKKAAHFVFGSSCTMKKNGLIPLLKNGVVSAYPKNELENNLIKKTM